MEVYIALLVAYLFSFGDALTPAQLKNRVSKAQCEPAIGSQSDILPCYDFDTMELVAAEMCDAYPTCCQYECKCIIKGAGTKYGEIPVDYQLQSLHDKEAKDTALAASTKQACMAESDEMDNQKNPAHVAKKEKSSTDENEPNPTTKPCATKAPQQNAMFNFFSRFSFVLNKAGLDSTVEC